MRPRSIALLPVLASLILVLLAACEDESNPAGPLQGLAPDFSLVDVNPNSPSTGQATSPRQHLGHVSAWYFGHAT